MIEDLAINALECSLHNTKHFSLTNISNHFHMYSLPTTHHSIKCVDKAGFPRPGHIHDSKYIFANVTWIAEIKMIHFNSAVTR